MPQITVWCLPPDLGEEKLNALFKALVAAAVSVEELGLRGKEDMLILFPPDMMRFGAGTEIMVQVSELWDKPERTPDIRNRLARVLGEVVKGMFPDAVVASRLDPPFRPAEHGFWTSKEVTIAPPPTDIEALRISPQCRSKFAGEFLRPARPTKSEVDEILDRLSMGAAREMHKLLVENHNQPAVNIPSTYNRQYHQVLQKPVGDKLYRLASGTNRAGRYQSQLWEVQPVSN